MRQGYHADLDNSSKTLQKKIRDNQLAQYNYILVVGKEEVCGLPHWLCVGHGMMIMLLTTMLHRR